jgi:hypothetical protein
MLDAKHALQIFGWAVHGILRWSFFPFSRELQDIVQNGCQWREIKVYGMMWGFFARLLGRAPVQGPACIVSKRA